MAKQTQKELIPTTEQTTNNQLLQIEPLIRIIRGQQVLLDSDLAILYGVETKRLNEQVKRNIERFPDDFMFQLTKVELINLKSQIATSSATNDSLRSQIVTLNTENYSIRSQNATLNEGTNLRTQIATSSQEVSLKSQIVTSSHGGVRYLPYAFTENGIAMLSSVLRSPIAIQVNIRIMRAFTAMRQFIASNAQIFQRLDVMEQNQLAIVADSVLFCDSIHTHDSTFTSEHQRGDTIYRERVVFRDRIEYRDRWRTRVQRDTIIDVRVEKEIVQLPPERYIPKFYKRCTMILWTIILFALICGLWRWYKKKDTRILIPNVFVARPRIELGTS